MNNERVPAEEAAPEVTQLPTEIPDGVMEEGLQLGLSTDAITAAYFLSPNRTFFTIASERSPERRQRDIVKLESVGHRVLQANAATRGIMRHNWVRTHGSVLAIDAAEFLGSDPLFADLLRDPDLAADMAYGFSRHTGRQAEADRRAALLMAETGVMQILNEGAKAHTSSRSTVLFARVADRTTEKTIDEYCARRDLLTSILSRPEFRKMATGEFGKKMMSSLINRVLATPSKEPALRENIESFLQFISDQANFDNLEAIAERNPEVIRLLTPNVYEHLSADELRVFCDEVAVLAKGVLSPNSIGSTSHLPSNKRLSFISVCARAPHLRRLLHSEDYRSLFFRGGLNWLFDSAFGTEEEKMALLTDPVFVSGLGRACDLGNINKVAATKTTPGDFLDSMLAGFVGDKWYLLQGSKDSTTDIEDSIRIFQRFYEEFRVDCFDLLQRWEEVGRDTNTTNQYIADTVQQMRDLERWEPGICRVLRDRFHIRHFGRYDIDQLLQQYDERDTPGPHAISLYASSDGNTALLQHAQNWLPPLFQKLRAKGINVIPRIFEAASPRECMVVLSQAKRKYGPARFGHVGVHGFEVIDVTHWGNMLDETTDASDLLQVTGTTYGLKQSSDKGMGSVMESGAPILGNTCFGARETGRPSIGRSWSVALGALVMTTAESAALCNVDITAGPDGLQVTPHFYSNATPVPFNTFDGLELRQGQDPTSNFTFDDPNFSPDAVTYYINQVRRTMP
jgi:hypothetical protein